MSFTVNQAFVTKFAEDFHVLAQQSVSRLENLVRRRPGTITGESFTIETLATAVSTVNRGRHTDLSYNNMAHVRRYADMQDLTSAELLDSMDKLKLLADPMNSYSQNLVSAINRGKDSIIIQAALGNVRTASGVSALPAGQIIVDGGTGLTVAKLRQAKLLLDEAEMDDSDFFRNRGLAQAKQDPFGNLASPSYIIVCSSKQIDNMLADSDVKSADYNSIKALVSGSINTYMGFMFIRVPSNQLPLTGSVRSPFAFAPRAIEYGVGLETNAKMDYIAHKDSWQTLAKGSFGAARAEDAGVVQINCLES
jgi:hypothetical protein